MAEVEAETKTTESVVSNTNLPGIMASLEMLKIETNEATQSVPRRVLRKRKSNVEVLNRRCSLLPRKRTCSEMEAEDSIKGYYLDKNIKKGPNNLETIYEEKDDTSENSMYMSAKRYKRMIRFDQSVTVTKIKKRRAKIRKVFGSKINFKRRCASMQLLLDKLNTIKVESPIKIDNEVK